MHSEDHFSEEGLLESRFSKSSFITSAEPHISEQATQKNDLSLWFILKVTKDFTFERTKMFVSFRATFHPKDFREK